MPLRSTVRLALEGYKIRFGLVLTLLFFSNEFVLAASPIKLSGPLGPGQKVSAGNERITPDGARVVYHADQDGFSIFEIFSVPIAGGTPLQLNGTLTAGGFVTPSGLAISSDGSRVLYRADQTTDGVFEAFSVPTGGGTSVTLNGAMAAGGDVTNFFGIQFSPNGSRVLYHADQTTDEVFEIFSVPSGGGAAVKLNGALAAGGDVLTADLQFSPSGSRVIYRADQTTDEVVEVFSVLSTGGALQKLNDPLVAGGDVTRAQISPDSSRVLYVADQTTDELFELYSVPTVGGAPVKLNGVLPAGGDVATFGFQISPDSSRVVYLADQNADNVDELFSVPSAGGAVVKLNGTLVAGGDVFSNGILLSPNGSRVVYAADQDADNVVDLFSVPSAGGAAVKLNGTLVAGGDVSISPNTDRMFTPDGSRVIYMADKDTDEVLELYSVPSVGGASIKLNGTLATGGDVQTTGLKLSTDGRRLLYYADQDTDGTVELYVTPVAGGAAAKVNGPVLAGGGVSVGAQFSPDGSRIVFTAHQDAGLIDELYSRVARLHSISAGSWDSGAVWNLGEAPDAVTEVDMNVAVNVTASGSAAVRAANTLDIGGGAGTSMLTLADGAVINVLNGVTIAAGGVIRGDGEIVGEFNDANEGEIRAATGERLEFSAASLINNNRIEVIGSTENLAEIEFTGSVFNRDDSGLITGQNSLMRFQGGLTNEGALAVGFGANNIIGDIQNDGEIVISGGGHATFYDDVEQNKDLVVSQVGSTTSVAVFFGDFTGSGGSTGGGDIFFEGDLQPGDSPALVTFENDVHFGVGAGLEIELGGTTPGAQHDQINVDGALELDGTLDVTLINGFAPQAGNTFDILDWDTLDGTFDTLSLAPLAGTLQWDTSKLYTEGILSVTLPGDHNVDGVVDILDYVHWRMNDGSPAGYDAWRGAYGEPVGPGSGAGSASPNQNVPEPGAMTLVVLALVCCLARGQRRDH